ncbi:MAG: aldo/keto reductase [Erysipelotrichaceae bacterium]|nr:aldo/keto reductase [Erysipelotrichaceae bacterium]
MKYIKLNNSDLTVSRVCLGCMSFGKPEVGQYQWTLDYDDASKIIQRAYHEGINFFDTSNNYSDGTSEQFVGKALKDYPRDSYVLVTKCYFNEGKLSPEAIHREVEKSLNNLDTDHIDILIMHRFDYDTPVEDTLNALDEEIQKGHIRYYGASAMYGYQFAEYCYKAQAMGLQPFTTLQNHYSPIYREDERDLIPVAEQFNVSRTSFAPYAAGRLARRDWSSDSKRYELDSREGTRYDLLEKEDRKIAERIYELSVKHGCSMSNICLAWQFAKGVASPIVGITKERYLDDTINAMDIELDEEEIAYIDELYIPHPITCNR